VLDAATACLMARPCPMPEATAERAVVVAPSCPDAPLVRGPSPDPTRPDGSSGRPCTTHSSGPTCTGPRWRSAPKAGTA
jgi:hypothetical protein